jgi:choline dehydrogenase-like flavoprotein
MPEEHCDVIIIGTGAGGCEGPGRQSRPPETESI